MAASARSRSPHWISGESTGPPGLADLEQCVGHGGCRTGRWRRTRHHAGPAPHSHRPGRLPGWGWSGRGESTYFLGSLLGDVRRTQPFRHRSASPRAGPLSPGWRRQPGLEIIDRGFLTVTGHAYRPMSEHQPDHAETLATWHATARPRSFPRRGHFRRSLLLFHGLVHARQPSTQRIEIYRPVAWRTRWLRQRERSRPTVPPVCPLRAADHDRHRTPEPLASVWPGPSEVARRGVCPTHDSCGSATAARVRVTKKAKVTSRDTDHPQKR